MPRELTSHQVNGCNEALKVTALDEPGHGGASHRYWIGIPFIDPVERHPSENVKRGRTHHEIRFQDGPIAEVGTNGITHEALLAILIDRLEGFQSGPYACTENSAALIALKSAQGHLKSRTEKRLARGVEGTHTI